MPALATLIDDFEDNVINTSIWDAAAGVTESGGKIVILPSTLAPYLRTLTSDYDATNSQIVVQVNTVTNDGTTNTLATGLVLQLDGNNQVFIGKVGANLLCVKKVAGVQTSLATFAFSLSGMAYWRMRESGGLFYWETSSTGTSWTPRFNTTIATNLFPVTALKVVLYAAYTGSETAPGVARFESVNPGQFLTGSASSTSSGSAALITRHTISGTATSTSAGTAAITIHTAAVFSLTGTATSTSAGTALFIILTPGQMTANAASFSSGSAALSISYRLTGTAQSFATGTATLTILPVVPDVSVTQYFYFEPPIVYDRPTTIHPPRPKYINAYARWQRGQARGRSVLVNGGVVTVLDSPTVDQTLSADYYYAGGHVYTITNVEADILSAAGLAVTPILVHFTIFPNVDIYPQTDTFPGYQDLILP